MLKCLGLERSPEGDHPIAVGPRSDSAHSTAVSAHEGTSTVNAESTDEEMESRLSRRSSVLVDLLSLFRRSSSFHVRAHQIGRSTDEIGDEDEDEEDTRNMTKEKILEAIRYKKEIIGKLKSQPWNMKRKIRTLKVARRHLQRQEAKVSRVRLYKAEFGRRVTQMSRWTDNLKIYLIPWEAKIKRIESHFGSVVSSYFTFLRWTLGVNIVMSLIMLMFVIIPEWLADSRAPMGTARYNRTMHLKVMPEDVRKKADMLTTVWDFGGHFQYSLLFYGYYSRETFFGDTIQYRVPVAFFLVNLVVLAYSFFIILRKMASNARTSKLSSGKTEQYVFNWKTFTGWDYTIGNAETAGNVHMANVIKFREAIAEYNVKLKEKFRWLQIAIRIFANILVFAMLGFSVWAILAVSAIKEKDTFLTQNGVSITISFITLVFPNFFELIGKMEQYHPRFALRIQLARVLCLYIVNYYTLIVSLMFMLDDLENERKELQKQYQLEYHKEVSQYQGQYGIHSRALRELLGIVNNTIFPDDVVTTTPAAPSPWTTVLSDFGPIGVQNPKAVVSKGRTNQNGTVFISQILGPNLNWNTSRPVRLNYVGTSEKAYAEPIRQRVYGDLCWETIIGQEISKVITMDLLMTIAAILFIDFFRGIFVRYCNTWWCWNLEKTFPEYGEFKVAENVLHLVNNQGMIWLGLFFMPMLPILNNIKLIILMYIRAWACMTCNVPARQIFRASRSSNFYLMLLLLMLFLCTLPVGYVIASKSPSKTCGPFADQPHFYSVIMDVLNENLPRNMVEAIRYMSSPGIVIPVLLLLLLIIYFLFALVRGLREANSDLSNQLMHERTEEKKKIFELAGGKKKRELILAKGNKKNKKDKRKSIVQTYSSDEDTQMKSFGSGVSRMSGRQFVPSLGSVSEVDHSEVEEEDNNDEGGTVYKKPKLTWKQNFMICIGLADPKEYMQEALRLTETDIEAGQHGEYYNEHIEEEEEEENKQKENEQLNLLTPNYGERRSHSRSHHSPSLMGSTHSHNSRGSHTRSHTSHPSRTSQDGSGHGSQEEDRSARDDSYRTASRGSSRMREKTENNDDVSKQGNSSASESYSKSQDSNHKTKSSGSSPSGLIENPLFDENLQARCSGSSHHSGSIAEQHTGSSGTSSVSQSRSLPAAVEIYHTQPSQSSHYSSRHSDSSYKKAARSLLEPVRMQYPGSHSSRQGSSGRSVDPTRPPSDEQSFRDPTPRVGGTPRESSPPLDDALVTSNPHSSYTSAMMSPIMADYSCIGGIDDSDGNDESTRLIPSHTPSPAARPKHRQQNVPSFVRPPRFRISTSPPRRRLENYDSDGSQRKFEMRIGTGTIHEGEESPDVTPASTRKGIQQTTV